MRPNDYTGRNQLLAALPVDDLKTIFSELHSVPLLQRDALYEVGAPIQHVYFPEEGVASILTTMENGASVEVGMVGFEGMLGLPIFFGSGISAHQVVVQLPGRALRMSAQACKAAFEKSPAIRTVVLGFFDSMLNLTTQTAACNRLHSAEQRFARWLLMSSDRLQSDDLPLTQEYLSAMLGIRRPGVTEIAGELQRSALIKYKKGQITIIDRAGLEELACECYSHDRQEFVRLIWD